MHESGVFVDWFAASQFHPAGGLPVIASGVKATFDPLGNCRHEFALSESVRGSHDSSVRVLCDGYRVSLSGNVGRFGRPDNLFNLGWAGTLEAANRILASLGLPPFTAGEGTPESSVPSDGPGNGGAVVSRGAFVSRIDLTCNYATGSDAQARAVIRWLAGQSVSRMKRGYSGDESVWFTNTRHMLKAYRKGAEMRKHGSDERGAQWAEENGIVRVEVELKKRLLHDLDMNRLDAINDDKLAQLFHEQTEIFRRVDMSDEPDILDAIPPRYRMTAAAWLAGQDVSGMMSRATLFRHARILREHGLDILQHRDVHRLPIRVRVVDLQPAQMPDWYELKAA